MLYKFFTVLMSPLFCKGITQCMIYQVKEVYYFNVYVFAQFNYLYTNI